MTARVSMVDGRLRIHRTGIARWLGTSVDVPLAHVRSVDAADHYEVKRWNKGVRLVGIQIPGLNHRSPLTGSFLLLLLAIVERAGTAP
jgi:hypothetical protein